MSVIADGCYSDALGRRAMTIEIDVAETDLPGLLARVEIEHEVVLSRGTVPVAKIVRIEPPADIDAAIERIFERRKGIPSTTVDEILEWIDEGRR